MRELKLDIEALYSKAAAGPYEYSILVDQLPVGRFACESYGVRITAPSTGEQAEVPNITVSIPRIDALMDLLVRNQVSPTHLKDVLEDWL